MKRLELGPRLAKRQQGAFGPRPEGGESSAEDEDGDKDKDEDDEPASDLLLMYNSVQGYCSAINELWAHQTSRGLHAAPRPQRVALTALKTSIAQGQHQRWWDEYTDRGLATICDSYTVSQIPDLSQKVWALYLGPTYIEQHF
jgi:hypothetical protein